MAVRKTHDWEAISGHYRAGVRSLRDIASEFGITEGAIRKRAKKEEWPRDLSEQIQAKAKDLVRKESVRKGTQGASEKEIIDSEAGMQAHIRISQRVDIPKKRELIAKLFDEIENQTNGLNVIEQLRLVLREGEHEDYEKLVHLVEKITSLPSRIKGVSDLTSAYKTLIGLERQAFGIDDMRPSDVDPLTQVLEEVAKRGKGLVQED